MGNCRSNSNQSNEVSESARSRSGTSHKHKESQKQLLTSLEENTTTGTSAAGRQETFTKTVSGKSVTQDAKRSIGENKYLRPTSPQTSSSSSPIANQDMEETASVMRERGLEHVKNKDYAKALNCHRRTLALHKQESQERNEDLATHYDDLGKVYQETSAANRAASYFHKALTIRLNLHGQDHLSTASSFDRIGSAYTEQGDYDKALNFHHKAKHVKKKLLGRDHAKTAKSFWNIGDVHFKKKNYNEALVYFNKALDVQGRVLKDDHPDKAVTQNSIGLIQEKMVQKAMAESQDELTTKVDENLD